MRRNQKFLIQDQSHVGEIRRTLKQWSGDLGLSEIKTEEVSIVVNELSTNILKHAKSGEVIATIDQETLSILALDMGPGIQSIPEAVIDGYSTFGTSGTGLGAIKRLADNFDIYSQPGAGTAVCALFHKVQKKISFEMAGFSLPVKGEVVSGDNWTYLEENGITRVFISDGLGHGLQAHEASMVGVKYFEEMPHSNPLRDVEALHHILRTTRGAAISVSYIDPHKKTVDHCGLGNITGNIISPGASKHLVSYNGTAGVQLRKTQSLLYPFEKESVIIFHSDGLSTNWNLKNYPGLIFKHPLLICGILYRDHSRKIDDVTVVAGRISQ